jgi:hypothetical protein
VQSRRSADEREEPLNTGSAALTLASNTQDLAFVLALELLQVAIRRAPRELSSP